MEAGQHNKKKILFIFFITITAGIFISAAFTYSIELKIIDNKVSFTSQSPLAEWDDPRQQDACEEAVSLMAFSWLFEIPNYSAKIWRDKLLALSDYEQEKYGENRDASLEDIKNRIFEDYFDYSGVKIKSISSSDDIVKELEAGRLVLIPANGQALKNPNFKAPGPERHMVLIKGYDYENDEFITNDPGTRKGANYCYPADVLFESIRPYKTGYHEPF
jgi:hypothetical protein